MSFKRIVGLIVALGLVATSGRHTASAQRSQSAGPPVPYVEAGVCPFEGCVYREWIALNAVGVRRDRRADSPVVFSLKKGERVTAITGVVVTTRAGRVQFSKPIDLPNLSGPLHIVPGQTLYLLTYRGEGVTLAWFEGRFYDEVDGSTAFFDHGCAHAPSRCVGTLVQQPRSVWWVQMKNAKGQIGWTSEPEKFDNKDALAGNGEVGRAAPSAREF
jgi:hypothetical protein